MATADQGYLVETIGEAAVGTDVLKLRWFPRGRAFGNLILSGDLEGTFEVQISPPDEDTWGVLYTTTAASPAVVGGLESIEFAGPCDVRFEVSAYTAGSVNAWLHVKD
jgi:hypothetical protein